LATNYQLYIGVQTILFTDIVGSTKFYQELGDYGAFKAVSEHFTLTYDCILKAKGAVVKTIGDSVMAAFSSTVAALKAARDLQEVFQNPKSPVKLRITVHRGKCLAVNLNSQIDYFGSTVNYTAKMQSLAGAGDIVFSQTVFRDVPARQFLKDHQIKVRKLGFSFLGQEEDPVYLWKPN